MLLALSFYSVALCDELEKREYNLHCFIIRVRMRVFAVVTNLKKAYCPLTSFFFFNDASPIVSANVLGLI